MTTSIQHVLDQCNSTGKSSLQLRYQDTTITKPGSSASKEATKAAPSFSISSTQLKVNQKYVSIALDLDAPAPTLSTLLSPILHSIDADLVAEGTPDAEGWVPLKSSSKPAVSYLPPNPPPFSTAHRYIFLLWEQPENLSNEIIKEKLGFGDEVGRWPRFRWDEDACEKKLELADVLGGNYFLCG